MKTHSDKPWLNRQGLRLLSLLPKGLSDTLGQWLTRYAHEPEFEIFSRLAELPGLVLDIGANRGHSALSVLRRTRRMQVVSVEPNPSHRGSLLLIAAGAVFLLLGKSTDPGKRRIAPEQ